MAGILALQRFNALKRHRVNTLALHRAKALNRESKFSEYSENSDNKKFWREFSENFRTYLRERGPGNRFVNRQFAQK